MKRVAIVGAGVSGLTVGNLLKDSCDVTIFEKESRPGGLIRCERVEGSLFHICGGHVFNTKNEKVSKWFWSQFDKNDFLKAERNSAVCMDNGKFVQYPIENHIYQLGEETQRKILEDWLRLANSPSTADVSGGFESFLMNKFGKTLYDIYFGPYNRKIWRRDLSKVPLEWLQGKLPMPTVMEMLLANINKSAERTFVHSSFYYPKNGGSQFLADTLANGLNIRFNVEVSEISKTLDGRLRVNGECFDEVVFCGNLKFLPTMLNGDFGVGGFGDIVRLESHGTTAVFCETDPMPYSWFSQPSSRHDSHRFICTGNFAPSNNARGKMTCTVEFTDYIEEDKMRMQLQLLPFRPRCLSYRYSKYTYPIQNVDTRRMVRDLAGCLGREKIRLCGRFAEWEYFNMDAAIASAIELVEATVV